MHTTHPTPQPTYFSIYPSYTSPVNFCHVWPRTVRGRPKLSHRWLKTLQVLVYCISHIILTQAALMHATSVWGSSYLRFFFPVSEKTPWNCSVVLPMPGRWSPCELMRIKEERKDFREESERESNRGCNAQLLIHISLVVFLLFVLFVLFVFLVVFLVIRQVNSWLFYASPWVWYRT